MTRILSKTAMTAAVTAAATIAFWGAAPAPASAGPISRACMGVPKGAAQPGLCGCIQQAADMTMSRSDQRLAAKMFKEPDRAQEIKMSKRANDDAFWDRYTAFGSAAQAMCS